MHHIQIIDPYSMLSLCSDYCDVHVEGTKVFSALILYYRHLYLYQVCKSNNMFVVITLISQCLYRGEFPLLIIFHFLYHGAIDSTQVCKSDGSCSLLLMELRLRVFAHTSEDKNIAAIAVW